jgi:hypothetical protein
MRREATLRDLVADVRRVLARLERMAARDSRTIDQMVLDCLCDCGPLSTNAIARLIRRRRADVLATCNLMLAAKSITRTTDDKKWSAE